MIQCETEIKKTHSPLSILATTKGNLFGMATLFLEIR